MEFHIDLEWVHHIMDLLTQFPVLIVAAGGMFLGIFIAQMIKQFYLAAHDGKPNVSEPRYNAGVRLLSALTTYFATVQLWDFFLKHDGIEEIVCIGWGAATPFGYAMGKLVARKIFGDDFVKGWGDSQ